MQCGGYIEAGRRCVRDGEGSLLLAQILVCQRVEGEASEATDLPIQHSHLSRGVFWRIEFYPPFHIWLPCEARSMLCSFLQFEFPIVAGKITARLLKASGWGAHQGLY